MADFIVQPPETFPQGTCEALTELLIITTSTPTAGDETPPTITNFNPVTFSNIGTFQPIMFDVQDDIALRAVFVGIRYPSGLSEWAYAAGTFETFFLTSSTTPITNGTQFTLQKSGGWPAPSFSVVVFAVDTSGNLT